MTHSNRRVDTCVFCGFAITRQVHDRHPNGQMVFGPWRDRGPGREAEFCPPTPVRFASKHVGMYDPIPDLADLQALEEWLDA